MKKLVIGFVISIIMVGCGQNQTQTQKQESTKQNNSRFTQKEKHEISSYNYRVIVDRETDAEYLVVDYVYGEEVFVTPLYNADGTLKTD